jgi:hypothetical protein
MHELGHNLGLRHGGGDSLNNKPNYESIMNYTFQFGWLPRSDGTSTLDYSRFALAVDEARLDERTGFGAAAGDPAASYFTLAPCSSTSLWPLTGPVDFDCDGAISAASVRADLSGDGAVTPLPGFDDWPHVTLKGGGIGLLGAPAGPAASVVDEPPLGALIAYQQSIDQALAAIHNPSAGPPPAPAPPVAAPIVAQTPPLVLSHLRIRPQRFRPARHGPATARTGAGARVTYRLSRAGTVRFTIERCARRCSHAGSFRRRSRAGTNAFRLRGRLAGRTLWAGRYRLVARPVQAGGRRGPASRAPFRLLARHT